ncbi:Uncharacterised protein [Burkholderia pseudomallei]|nr:Uncharacterised protein [Burkholderia pseudomallei]VBQ49577.1 Uncharacterised protein [Burkholderia pseudomallei]
MGRIRYRDDCQCSDREREAVEKPESRHEEVAIEQPSLMDAVRAILHYPLWRGMHPFESASLDWPAIAGIIKDGASSLSLDEDQFVGMDQAIQQVPDDVARSSLRDVLQAWAEANWSLVEARLRDEALKLFLEKPPRFYSAPDRFCEFIDQWRRLRGDSQLLTGLWEAAVRERADPEVSVKRLCAFEGDQIAARKVVALVMPHRSSFHCREELASIIWNWAGDCVWGQLQFLIWCTDEQRDAESTLGQYPALVRVAELMHEFNIPDFAHSDYRLADLAPESRASWRRELRGATLDDEALREAVTETLLWWGSPRLDREVLFAVLEIYDGDAADRLQFFLTHADPLVRRRARAVIDMVRCEPDATELLSQRQGERAVPSPRANFAPAVTWIGDARIEQLIRDTLNEAARRAGSAIDNSLDSGEETHVALLFERLGAAFSSITNRLTALANETRANETLSLKLEHRIVGKREEGGTGIGTQRFSADVCLLFEARDAGRCFARRASLIQAKRMYRRKTGLDVDYYPLKANQLKDISDQTPSSFLLLLGPECEGIAAPMIPARLVLDMIERGESAHHMAPATASLWGKSMGDWLLEDVIGLWAGDWRGEVISRAEGGKDRQPYLLVELIVERVRRDFDRPDA